jgi:hypothetical protein
MMGHAGSDARHIGHGDVAGDGLAHAVLVLVQDLHRVGRHRVLVLDPNFGCFWARATGRSLTAADARRLLTYSPSLPHHLTTSLCLAGGRSRARSLSLSL